MRYETSVVVFYMYNTKNEKKNEHIADIKNIGNIVFCGGVHSHRSGLAIAFKSRSRGCRGLDHPSENHK